MDATNFRIGMRGFEWLECCIGDLPPGSRVEAPDPLLPLPSFVAPTGCNERGSGAPSYAALSTSSTVSLANDLVNDPINNPINDPVNSNFILNFFF